MVATIGPRMIHTYLFSAVWVLQHLFNTISRKILRHIQAGEYFLMHPALELLIFNQGLNHNEPSKGTNKCNKIKIKVKTYSSRINRKIHGFRLICIHAFEV